ncbi:MAG: MarR family transcriptional regulator, partial [Limnohabitans sp.]
SHDKRQSLVSLTPVGHRKVKPLLVKARAHEMAVMAELGLEQADQLKQVLEQLIASHRTPRSA